MFRADDWANEQLWLTGSQPMPGFAAGLAPHDTASRGSSPPRSHHRAHTADGAARFGFRGGHRGGHHDRSGRRLGERQAPPPPSLVGSRSTVPGAAAASYDDDDGDRDDDDDWGVGDAFSAHADLLPMPRCESRGHVCVHRLLPVSYHPSHPLPHAAPSRMCSATFRRTTPGPVPAPPPPPAPPAPPARAAPAPPRDSPATLQAMEQAFHDMLTENARPDLQELMDRVKRISQPNTPAP